MDEQQTKYKACVTTDLEHDTEELSLSEIDKMCEKYNLKWRLLGNVFQVFSWCGKWYFKPFGYQTRNNINLYHRNQGVYLKDDLTFYHKQDVKLKTPYEIIEYIHRHDNFKYSKKRTSKLLIK